MATKPAPEKNRINKNKRVNEETTLFLDPEPIPEEEAVGLEAGEDEVVEKPKKKSNVGWYAWRVFWAVVVCVVIAVFVKGWVDAGGDVEPLRTIMNYQYRFGTSFPAATRTLYQDGGYGRYYQGLGPALIQGPVSRFGDTAANAGILALLASNSYLKGLPSLVQTIFASLCAATFRMTLTPIDTLKTTLQVQGKSGTALLRQRIKNNGVGSLWWGAIATALATFVGHYPWFATYNFLTENIPEPPHHPLIVWLLRLAFIGFMASIVSDSVSNSLRVIKTYRQVNDSNVSYTEAARLVILQDGLLGLFGRGLGTRILCNGLQGLLFSILWKLFLDLWDKQTGAKSVVFIGAY